MPLLLTNPFSPAGTTDPADAAPRAKIVQIMINLMGYDDPALGQGPPNDIHFCVSFGDVDAETGVWNRQKKTPKFSYSIRGSEFVAAIAEQTTADENHSIYAGIKRYLWEWLQDKEPDTFAGTIE